MAKGGVLLMGFGGPDSLAAITPFMLNMTGRAPSPEALSRIEAKYLAIGGASPINARTEEQAAGLRSALGDIPVAVGMRYWKPYIADGLRQLQEAGVERIAAVPMAPFGSAWSTKAYRQEIDSFLAGNELSPEIDFIDDWSEDELFPQAVAAAAARAMEGAGPVDLIAFTAHSLPSGSPGADSYAARVKEKAAAVMAHLPDVAWRVVFQSKGMSGGEWLGPLLDELLEELSPGSRLLIVPIGFSCDHVETIYDLDIEARSRAEGLGIEILRADALNDEPLFIELLAKRVRASLGK